MYNIFVQLVEFVVATQGHLLAINFSILPFCLHFFFKLAFSVFFFLHVGCQNV